MHAEAKHAEALHHSNLPGHTKGAKGHDAGEKGSQDKLLERAYPYHMTLDSGKICITSRVPLAATKRMGRRRIRPQAGDQVVGKYEDTSKG